MPRIRAGVGVGVGVGVGGHERVDDRGQHMAQRIRHSEITDPSGLNRLTEETDGDLACSD